MIKIDPTETIEQNIKVEFLESLTSKFQSDLSSGPDYGSKRN